MTHDRMLAIGEFRKRYPALTEEMNIGAGSEVSLRTASPLALLATSGVVRFVHWDKVSFNEEAVAAAHAAEMLRRQGERNPVDEVKEEIQRTLQQRLTGLLGMKAGQRLIASAKAEVIGALQLLKDAGTIEDFQVDSKLVPSGLGTISITARPTHPSYSLINLTLELE